MPGGRPRKTIEQTLPDNWQDIILEMAKDGCSDVEIRAEICLKDNGGKFNHIYWDALKARDDEFYATIQKAKVLCQAWWERTARVNLCNPNFQTGSWYANMKNRFGWRDKTEVEHSVNLTMQGILSNVVDSTGKNSRGLAKISHN